MQNWAWLKTGAYQFFVFVFYQICKTIKYFALNGKCGVKYNCILMWYNSRMNLTMCCKSTWKQCITQREIITLFVLLSLMLYCCCLFVCLFGDTQITNNIVYGVISGNPSLIIYQSCRNICIALQTYIPSNHTQ